jgi:hypothetical protein
LPDHATFSAAPAGATVGAALRIALPNIPIKHWLMIDNRNGWVVSGQGGIKTRNINLTMAVSCGYGRRVKKPLPGAGGLSRRHFKVPFPRCVAVLYDVRRRDSTTDAVKTSD